MSKNLNNTKTRQSIKIFIEKNYPDHIENILLADGYDECLVGFTTNQAGNPIAVYDKQKMIKVIAKHLKSDDGEALEYFDYNIECAYVGEYTPKYLNRYE
jgi:hypothetical protein